VIAAMRDVKDPGTGQHALAFVLPCEDAPVVGLWGEHHKVFPCGGGNHGPMMPTYEMEVASVMGGLLLADFYSERPQRTLQPTARPTVPRPTLKPRPIALQGDVTDED